MNGYKKRKKLVKRQNCRKRLKNKHIYIHIHKKKKRIKTEAYD